MISREATTPEQARAAARYSTLERRTDEYRRSTAGCRQLDEIIRREPEAA